MSTRFAAQPHEPTARLLERAARATPAAVDVSSHGWWLRHSETRQGADAVIAHSGDGWLEDSVDAAERFYRAYESPARFEVCAGCVPGLDVLLERRAYSPTAPVSLETCAADSVATPRPRRHLRTRLAPAPTPDWLLVATDDSAPAEADQLKQLLRRVRGSSTYVTVYERDVPVAIGRSVTERGWAGIFDMATLPLARGRGAGRLVLSTLAYAAIDRGAQWLYLQVQRGNDRARRLYRKAGFRETDTYHYWVHPMS